MYWQVSFCIVYLGLSMTEEQWSKLLLESGFKAFSSQSSLLPFCKMKKTPNTRSCSSRTHLLSALGGGWPFATSSWWFCWKDENQRRVYFGTCQMLQFLNPDSLMYWVCCGLQNNLLALGHCSWCREVAWREITTQGVRWEFSVNNTIRLYPGWFLLSCTKFCVPTLLSMNHPVCALEMCSTQR